MFTDEQVDRIKRIFLPHLIGPQDRLRRREINLVHYTSAETGQKILKEKAFWMRKANYMPDYSEILTGTIKVKEFFEPTGPNKEIWEALDNIHSGLKDKIIQLYDQWLPEVQTNTYLTCVSEHLARENDFGRLSMWRGYGGDCGVALVLNETPFLAQTNVLGAYSYPVIYQNPEQYFQKILPGITENTEFLESLGADNLMGIFFGMLQSFAFCLKHQGFEEEREWRVVFLPKLAAQIRLNSDLKDIPLPIEPAIEIVNGTPQKVHKIPLKEIPGNKPEETLNLEIRNLINRIIIGPCKFPEAIREAFIESLGESGVENAAERVHISNIPLRM